jgi:Uma2 family endonuclease
MVSSARQLHHSYDEYLRLLEISQVKLEYCSGEIYAMAGGTPAHADLSAAMIHLLMRGLSSDCRVSTSDLKVRIQATDLATFPDVTVVCGPRETAANDPRAVVNPTLLVEVTSRSTEDYDRGEKLRCYQQIPSLQTLLVVSHRVTEVTIFERTVSGWSERKVGGGQQIALQVPKVELAVDELYRGIQLDAS